MDYVVVAELRIAREHVAELAARLDRHAFLSVKEEGCFAFDVCQHKDDPTLFLLYEVYRDEAAYAVHRGTERYKEFVAAVRDLLIGRNGTMFWSRSVLSRREQAGRAPSG
jgi:quinol monooxygenase YgiN